VNKILNIDLSSSFSVVLEAGSLVSNNPRFVRDTLDCDCCDVVVCLCKVTCTRSSVAVVVRVVSLRVSRVWVLGATAMAVAEELDPVPGDGDGVGAVSVLSIVVCGTVGDDDDEVESSARVILADNDNNSRHSSM
jgi:hypothetical protein